MTRRRLWIVFALILVAGGAGWVYFNVERVTDRVHVGFQGEAARNPMLALERLVERMGVEARSVESFRDLDSIPDGATLILAGERAGMTVQRAARLAHWVADGGHLIVEAEDAAGRDPLLTALGIGRRAAKTPTEKSPVEIRLPGAGTALKVAMYSAMEIVDLGRRSAYAVDQRGATLLLDLTQGRGRVTVLPSLAFVKNSLIGDHDHAAFAWGLIQLKPQPGLVLIAPRMEPPSVLTWLVREALAPLVAAAALLTLCLWRAAIRFGPVQPPAEPQRRRLLDHLRASGHFLWSATAHARLLAAAREVCLQRIARSRPALVGLPPAERTVRFAALAELSADEVEHALTGTASTPRAFTAAVRTLQHIEEKLTRRASA
jgi:hypothetical protein